MKHKLLLFILFSVVVSGFPRKVEGQFWKKKSERRHHRNDNDTTTADDKTPKEKRKEARRERADSRKAREEARDEEKRKERQERKREKAARKKNKELKERKEKVKHSKKKLPPAVVRLKEEPAWPPTTVRSRYRVEILSPLYLDELVKAREAKKDKIPDKAMAGISFFEGVQIAADSLKNAGYNIDIYIHDVASATDSVGLLIRNGKLDSADVVIGAVQSKDVAALADFARSRQVNFVSALSPSDAGEKENPFFTMLEPSLKSHCEFIARDIQKKYPHQQITILHRTSTLADENAFKYLTTNDSVRLNYKQLICNSLPSKDSLPALFEGTRHPGSDKPFDTSKTNIVIIPILDRNFADSLMNALSDDFPGTRFLVYGMPSWNGAKFLRWNDLPNVEINVTYPFRFSSSSPAVQYVAATCKSQFGHKATELVYRGYEAMFWYAGLLKKYGTIFNEKYDDVSTAPFTKFEVNLLLDNDLKILHNENTNISIGTYQTGANKTE